MAARKGEIKRVRIDRLTEGGWMKPITSTLQKNTLHDFWKGSQTGGKAANNAMHIAGAIHDNSPDVLKFVKKFDPQNSSGSVKEALDIMIKLEKATQNNSLFQSIQPLQNILGSQLYNAFKSAGAKSKAQQKIKEEPKPDVIALLIAAAIEKVAQEDADKAVEAAELLNESEIGLITQAYNRGGGYESIIEIPEFVAAINELIPVFKSLYGALV